MTTLDPQIARELEALEALFAEDVRALAPPMPLATKTRLEERVAAGFPRERKQRSGFSLPRWTLPAMGVAASVLIALIVAVGALRDDTGGLAETLSSDGGSGAASVAAPTAPLEAADRAAGGTATKESAPATAQSFDDQAPAPLERLQRERKVEREVELALRVGAGQLEEAADGVVRTTQRLGGYVADSQVAARGRGGSATFTLRVPTKRLDHATSQLSKLGHVTSLNQSSHDITAAFVSAQELLSDARAERRALLRALGKATTPQQISSLRARIRGNRSEIAQHKGQLKSLRRRADLSTISVEVVARGKGSAGAPGDDDSWSPSDAAKDALRVLEVAAGVVVIALAAMLPLGLIGGLAYLATRGARRRRREHALDAA